MSSVCPVRTLAIAAAFGIAGACLSLPAFADDAVAVTFQANSPWAQEVGSVDHDNSSHDYTVAVEAGKTLQVNLVTRNPNVFLKIKNETTGKQLVDTYQTGATTWSTENATAATYKIRVYVQPDAMQRGDVAKYALQIGQYGAKDLQPATTEVTFKDNNPWAQAVGSLDSSGTAQDYTVALAAGKTLQVNLVTQNTNVHFKVKGPDGQELTDSGKAGAATWSAPVVTAGTYTIQVYVDPAAVPPGHTAQFAVQIGQYQTEGAQPSAPAAAGSAAAPAAASSATH